MSRDGSLKNPGEVNAIGRAYTNFRGHRKAIREPHNQISLTQTSLARELGVSKSTISGKSTSYFESLPKKKQHNSKTVWEIYQTLFKYIEGGIVGNLDLLLELYCDFKRDYPDRNFCFEEQQKVTFNIKWYSPLCSLKTLINRLAKPGKQSQLVEFEEVFFSALRPISFLDEYMIKKNKVFSEYARCVKVDRPILGMLCESKSSERLYWHFVRRFEKCQFKPENDKPFAHIQIQFHIECAKHSNLEAFLNNRFASLTLLRILGEVSRGFDPILKSVASALKGKATSIERKDARAGLNSFNEIFQDLASGAEKVFQDGLFDDFIENLDWSKVRTFDDTSDELSGT